MGNNNSARFGQLSVQIEDPKVSKRGLIIIIELAAMPWFCVGCRTEHLGDESKTIKTDGTETVENEDLEDTDDHIVVTSPPGGPQAATNLEAAVDCDSVELDKGIARLSWTPAAEPGRGQRVDVTIFGFEQGAFESSDSLACDQTSLVWDKLHGQAIHRWRVLTLQPEGWVPSETASFVGPTCVADFVNP